MVSIKAFSTFEVQLLRLEWKGPVLIATIYRPPYLVKDFVFEFMELMGFITTNFNCFLLVGDFNVHGFIACQSNLE